MPVVEPTILLAVTRYPSAPPVRREFFEQFCRSSLDAAAVYAGAVVVRVYDTDEHANVKRQRALDEARTEGFRWIFHCDDDVLLARNALFVLRAAADASGAAVIYSDYIGVCLPGVKDHPMGPVFMQQSATWDPVLLHHRNLVDTKSLFDVEQLHRHSVRWDPSLARYQDWDLALQIARAGLVGAYVPRVLFHAYYPAEGITHTVPHERALAALEAKYPEVQA